MYTFLMIAQKLHFFQQYEEFLLIYNSHEDVSLANKLLSSGTKGKAFTRPGSHCSAKPAWPWNFRNFFHGLLVQHRYGLRLIAILSLHKGHSFNLTAHSGQVTWCQHGWKTISFAPSKQTTHFKSISLVLFLGRWLAAVVFSDSPSGNGWTSAIGEFLNKNGSSEFLIGSNTG